MSGQLGPLFDRKDYAGFWRRSLALLIDLVLWNAFVLVEMLALAGLYVPESAVPAVEAVASMVAFLVLVAYNLAFRMTTRGTLGYRIVRIEYRFVLDRPAPGYMRAYRAFIAVWLMMIFGLDHLWILLDPKKQAWHDKVSGFYVVKRGAQPVGRQHVSQRVVNFMGFTFFVWDPTGEPESVSATEEV